MYNIGFDMAGFIKSAALSALADAKGADEKQEAEERIAEALFNNINRLLLDNVPKIDSAIPDMTDMFKKHLDVIIPKITYDLAEKIIKDFTIDEETLKNMNSKFIQNIEHTMLVMLSSEEGKQMLSSVFSLNPNMQNNNVVSSEKDGEKGKQMLSSVFSFKPTKNSIRSADSHSSLSMTDKEINPSPNGADLNLHRFNPNNNNVVSSATSENVTPPDIIFAPFNVKNDGGSHKLKGKKSRSKKSCKKTSFTQKIYGGTGESDQINKTIADSFPTIINKLKKKLTDSNYDDMIEEVSANLKTKIGLQLKIFEENFDLNNPEFVELMTSAMVEKTQPVIDDLFKKMMPHQQKALSELYEKYKDVVLSKGNVEPSAPVSPEQREFDKAIQLSQEESKNEEIDSLAKEGEQAVKDVSSSAAEEINSIVNEATKVVKDVSSSSNGGKKTRKKRQSKKLNR